MSSNKATVVAGLLVVTILSSFGFAFVYATSAQTQLAAALL